VRARCCQTPVSDRLDEPLVEERAQRLVGLAEDHAAQVGVAAMAVDQDQRRAQPRVETVLPRLDLGLTLGGLAVGGGHRWQTNERRVETLA
jgi:hypothetical protein